MCMVCGRIKQLAVRKGYAQRIYGSAASNGVQTCSFSFHHSVQHIKNGAFSCYNRAFVCIFAMPDENMPACAT